jgi:hypothetical protein
LVSRCISEYYPFSYKATVPGNEREAFESDTKELELLRAELESKEQYAALYNLCF